jgi:hypothetical protein
MSELERLREENRILRAKLSEFTRWGEAFTLPQTGMGSGLNQATFPAIPVGVAKEMIRMARTAE